MQDIYLYGNYYFHGCSAIYEEDICNNEKFIIFIQLIIVLDFY